MFYIGKVLYLTLLLYTEQFLIFSVAETFILLNEKRAKICLYKLKCSKNYCTGIIQTLTGILAHILKFFKQYPSHFHKFLCFHI